MSGAAEHGRLLVEQRRPDLAEEHLRRALSEDPEDVASLVRLAACHLDLGKPEDALTESEHAVGLAPDWDVAHRLLAHALLANGRAGPAEASAREAVGLDPESAANHAVLAHTFMARRQWEAGRDAAERGLELDPEDDECANLRAMCLIQLGRGQEADLALDATLSRDPENPDTHRNLGWAALHRGDAHEAIVHYREALRLDPTDEASREGLVEALHARNVVYRVFLRGALLLTRVPPRTAWMIMIGTVVARNGLRRVAESQPALAPVMWTLYGALVAFVLMSWVAAPVFDLVLRFDRDGRHALSPAQLVRTHWLLGMLGAILVGGVLWQLGVPGAGPAAACLGVLVLPAMVTLGRPPGKRALVAAWTVALALAAGTWVVTSTAVEAHREAAAPYVERLSERALEDVDVERAEVATWQAADRDAWLALRARSEEMDATRKVAAASFMVFVFGFVAFTWVVSSL